MNDGPHRVDTWIQLGILLLAIFGAVWNVGGQLGEIRQQLKDDAEIQEAQARRIGNLEGEVLDLTKHLPLR
jgi:hypothetical protein